MKNKQTLVTIGIIVTIMLVAGYATWKYIKNNQYNNSDVALTLGTDDSAQYTSLNGDMVNIADFDGTVRVVNSWASWSPLSKAELADLEKLGATYKDKGVHIIAINRNEDTLRAQRYLEQLGDFTHINFLLDGDDAFYDRMDGKAMPETLYFDRAGNIVTHVRGDASYDEMVTYVEAALAED